MNQLAAWADGGGWFYLSKNTTRPTHNGFIISMTLWTVMRFIKVRSIWKAIPNENEATR